MHISLRFDATSRPIVGAVDAVEVVDAVRFGGRRSRVPVIDALGVPGARRARGARAVLIRGCGVELAIICAFRGRGGGVGSVRAFGSAPLIRYQGRGGGGVRSGLVRFGAAAAAFKQWPLGLVRCVRQPRRVLMMVGPNNPLCSVVRSSRVSSARVAWGPLRLFRYQRRYVTRACSAGG